MWQAGETFLNKGDNQPLLSAPDERHAGSPVRRRDRQGLVWNCLITLLLLATLSAVAGSADGDGAYTSAAQSLAFLFLTLFGLCALGAVTDGLRGDDRDERRHDTFIRDSFHLNGK